MHPKFIIVSRPEKTMLLYGSSGDYGEPRFEFLNRISRELKDYIRSNP